MNLAAIELKSVSKTFRGNRRALDSVSIQVNRGEMVALIGASGSGKSTLLRQIAGLACADRVGGSSIEVFGRPVQSGGEINHRIRDLRRDIGFVFQQFNLVGRLPVLTNVLTGELHRMPLWRRLIRRFTDDERTRAFRALERVGIAECALQRASTLSGGQLQRAAIARSLLQGAQVLLADEPIASLDPASARNVMEILTRVNREDGCTVLVSLHQVDIAMKYCARTIALNHGRVVFDGPSADLTRPMLNQLYASKVHELYSDREADAQESARATVPLFMPVSKGDPAHV